MARLISVQPHYIRANESSRIPRRWVYLDTEAHDDLHGGTRTQTWRLGVTCYDHNEPGDTGWRESDWRTHTDPAAMWHYIDGRTKARARTIVVAHNIGYDLRISHALTELPALGWTLEQFGMSGRSLTMTWRRDKRTLVLVDSMTWWPMALHKIGLMVGLVKPELPAWDDTDEAWEFRCRADVEILQRANRQLLAWIESADLGNWQKTGAGMAWANWRHQHYTHRVLVHADEEARNAEVCAIGTARVEAWRHGQLVAGPFTEWDLPLAYPRIASEIRVPTRLQGHVRGPSMRWLERLPTYRRAIVRATVTTDVPTLGVQHDGRWVWPVGTFTGWWWDVELIAAAGRAESVKLHHAVTYQAAMALKDWGRWVIDVCTDETGAYSALQRATAKHWARALIGRFGAKYPLWVNYGEAPEPGLEMGDLYDSASGQVGKFLTMGDRFYVGLEESYVADACPAILGVVMAECRTRLWRIIELAGPEHVVYMDTDSVITDPSGTHSLDLATKEGDGWGLRPKARHRSLQIFGPRQLITGTEAKMAGVPKSAKRTGTDTFKGEVWEGVETAIRRGHSDRVIIRDTKWKVNPVDHRRQHVAGHETRPYRVDQAQEA